VSSAVASALGKGGATALGVLKLASVPYLVVLALLFTFQRTILFPRPADVADPTLSGGRLITLPASKGNNGEILTSMQHPLANLICSTVPPATSFAPGFHPLLSILLDAYGTLEGVNAWLLQQMRKKRRAQ